MSGEHRRSAGGCGTTILVIVLILLGFAAIVLYAWSYLSNLN